MAAWQFKIEFIPRRWAERNAYDASLVQGEDGYDVADAWVGDQPREGFQHELDGIIPRARAWHEDLLFWGSTTGHDIQVGFENRTVSYILLRVGLYDDFAPVLDRALPVAHRLDCVWFYPEHRTIEVPTRGGVRRAVTASSAARFVDGERARARRP